jgi:hypothetical protein
MAPMPVVLVLAAVAILAGAVAVAMGRGGELALPVPDSARYGRELVTASDLATFRPPAAFLGYSAQATDEALRRIARVIAERDTELAMLRHELAVLRARQFQSGAAAGPPAAGGAAVTALDPFVAMEPDLPGWSQGDFGPPDAAAAEAAPAPAAPRQEAAPADAGLADAPVFSPEEPDWGDDGWQDAGWRASQPIGQQDGPAGEPRPAGQPDRPLDEDG